MKVDIPSSSLIACVCEAALKQQSWIYFLIMTC